MGVLKVDSIDLNNPNIVEVLQVAIQKIIESPTSYFPLEFKPSYYLMIPNGTCPNEQGWYVILNGQVPIYVGITDDLNARLNTNQRSLDGYARKDRPSDSERNLIKRFSELGVIKDMRVCIITEKELCSELGVETDSLSKLDRENIEKFINIIRCHFRYR